MTGLGFDYRLRASGEVLITRHGTPVTTLRGAAVQKFLKRVESGDPQKVMARATGNYKRGNEPKR